MYHRDIGVGMPKGFSGREPCKTGIDNHGSLHSLPHSRGAIAWGCLQPDHGSDVPVLENQDL